MKPIFGINNSCLLFLLIVQARSNQHQHHHSHHGDDHHSKSSHRSSRIWGSLPAHRTRWKFMAVLEIPLLKQQVGECSAILINNRSLLTAAHCLQQYSYFQPIQIMFKTIYSNNDPGIVHQTRSVKIHEQYWNHVGKISEKRPYDIAIVKLESPIVLDPNKGIDQVDLPIAPDGQQYPFDPNTCYLVAYGEEKPAYPDRRLQQVKVKILPKKLCKKVAVDMERQICYGYVRRPSRRTIPKATANGDSGGALLCKTMHFHTGKHRKQLPRYVLIALNTAQVKGNDYQEHFSFGVRITKYMDWIQQNS